MKPFELLCCIALCALVATAPAAAQVTQPRLTTSDGRPLASSLPVKGPLPRKRMQALAFEELARHIDEPIFLTTIYGRHIEGKVDSVSGSTLRLRVSAGAGYAITNFERANIRSLTGLK